MNADEERRRRLHVGPWRIDITLRPGIRSEVPLTALARVMAAALQAGGAPGPASIGLILSDDAELAELNEAHMGHAGPTDVLSFPLLPPEAYPAHEGRPLIASGPAAPPLPFALPPGVRPHLGDVIVSVERAIAQAAEGRGGQTGEIRWSSGDELRLLALHGTLHVCGWDHAEPAEEAAMRALERSILGLG